jgi:pilus assembly protein CpaB
LSSRVRTILIIFVGFVLFVGGVGATWLLINRINAQTQTSQQQLNMTLNPVVVVNRDMHLGELLSATDLSIVQVPANAIPLDALSTVSIAVGKIVKSDLSQGEMVLQHNLADPTNNNHDISFILEDGQVLMAFPATDLMSTENVIQRGDIIDIFATYQINDDNLPGGTPTPTPNPTENPGVVTSGVSTTSSFTTDVFQQIPITAVVMQVITDYQGTPTGETKISAYLLALSPQDALVLKYLKDNNAVFDIVIRSPTSQTNFTVSSVDENFVIKQYSLSK